MAGTRVGANDPRIRLQRSADSRPGPCDQPEVVAWAPHPLRMVVDSQACRIAPDDDARQLGLSGENDAAPLEVRPCPDARSANSLLGASPPTPASSTAAAAGSSRSFPKGPRGR